MYARLTLQYGSLRPEQTRANSAASQQLGAIRHTNRSDLRRADYELALRRPSGRYYTAKGQSKRLLRLSVPSSANSYGCFNRSHVFVLVLLGIHIEELRDRRRTRSPFSIDRSIAVRWIVTWATCAASWPLVVPCSPTNSGEQTACKVYS